MALVVPGLLACGGGGGGGDDDDDAPSDAGADGAPDDAGTEEDAAPDGSLPGACGDGTVDVGEACDDGDLVDGDGCDSNCTPTGCGNGIVTAKEICWGGARRYAAGEGPNSIALGDLDGDRDLEIAVAAGEASELVVLGSDGDGFDASFSVPLDVGPVDVVAADFDGDGSVDLAASHTAGVKVAFNDGTGAFPSIVDLDEAGTTFALVAGDVEPDGDVDLVLSNITGVTWFENDGSGTFDPHGIGDSDSTVSMDLADAGGDGDLDLFGLDVAGSSQLYVLEFDGGFESSRQSFGVTGGSARAIAVGDFDGDDLPDVFATSSASSLAGFVGAADGSLDHVWDVEAGVWAGSFTAVDLDGDFDLDLATANPSTGDVGTLENDGAAALAASVTYAAGRSPSQVRAGDLDDDDDVDLVSLNEVSEDVSVLLRDGGGFTAARSFDPAVTVDRVISPSPTSLAAADFDGDGDVDLATAHVLRRSVHLLENDGTGELTAGPIVEAIGGCAGCRYLIAAGDLDDDGDIDLASAPYEDSGVTPLANDGTGVFSLGVVSGGGSQTALALGDLDGDLDLDVVAAGVTGQFWVRLFDAGAFGGATMIDLDFDPKDVAVADFDGDGVLDVAAAMTGGGGVKFALGDGTGAFAPPIAFGEGTTCTALALGDLDGDGDTDVGAARFGPEDIVLENDGDGGFVASPVARAASSWEIAAADVDRDGIADLLDVEGFDGEVHVLPGVAGGVPAESVSYEAGASPFALAIADFDGDGLADLATANYDGAVTLLLARP